MCFTKRREKSRRVRMRFEQLNKTREGLCKEHHYSRFFLEILLFMENSIKKQILSPVGLCSWKKSTEVLVRQKFHSAFQKCSMSEKLNYFSRTLDVCSANIDLKKRITNQRKFMISMRSGWAWSSSEQVRLSQMKLETAQHILDLRKYLVRKSKSGIPNSYVLEAIFPTEPEKIRFSFENSQNVEEDMSFFIQTSEIAYKQTVEMWIKQIEYLESKPPPSVIKKSMKKQSRQLQMQALQKDIWIQVIKQVQKKKSNDESINKQKKEARRFRFTEESSEQEDEKIIPSLKIKSSSRSVSQQISNLPLSERNLIVPGSTRTMATANWENSERIKKGKSSVALLVNQEPMTRNEKNILKILFPWYQLREIDLFSQFKEMMKIEESESLTIEILKHKHIKRIKSKVKIKNQSPKMLTLGILNFINYPGWNSLISNVEIKGKMLSENCMIVQMNVKGYSIPFNFLVHTCEYHHSYLIGIKIYEENYKKIEQSSCRFFSSAIIKLISQRSSCKITYDIFYGKNADFTIDFIKSITNLSAYLKTFDGKEQTKQHLRFGWKIDKEMKNQCVDLDRRSNQYSYKSQEFYVSQIQKEEENIEPDFKTINNSTQKENSEANEYFA